MTAPTRSPRLNLFVANADTRRYLPRPATEEALALLEQRVVVERAEATRLHGELAKLAAELATLEEEWLSLSAEFESD